MRIKYVLNTICIIILNDKILVPNIYNNDITKEINKSPMTIRRFKETTREFFCFVLFSWQVNHIGMVCKRSLF